MRFECRCKYRADSLLKMKLCSREASRLEFLNVNWLARICLIFLAPKAKNLAICQYVYMPPMFALLNWMSLHVRHASQETLSSILSHFSWFALALEPKSPRFINRLVIKPFGSTFMSRELKLFVSLLLTTPTKGCGSQARVAELFL